MSKTMKGILLIIINSFNTILSRNTPFSYSQLQDSKTLENQFIEYGLSSTISEKKLPKRAPTSIVASANFPEEEVDFEEDSKKFCEDPVFDEYKVILKW